MVRASGTQPVEKQDIVRALHTLGVRPGDVLWAHSSLSAFGYVEGGADTVIDALLECVGPQGSVALPTFTWGVNHAKDTVLFDVMNDPCETGRIPETFRKRAGVRRSLHVCHSVAAWGSATQRLLGDSVHSFWGNAVFDALYELDAWNIMLGVGYQSCTALHAAEEIVQVPYRAYRDYTGSVVRLPDGTEQEARSVEFLRQDGSSNDFGKVEAILEEKGALSVCPVGKARVTAARMRAVIDTAVDCLRKDPRFLSK
jgi:aminoglycoside 3-N-acetyltransferase